MSVCPSVCLSVCLTVRFRGNATYSAPIWDRASLLMDDFILVVVVNQLDLVLLNTLPYNHFDVFFYISSPSGESIPTGTSNPYLTKPKICIILCLWFQTASIEVIFSLPISSPFWGLYPYGALTLRLTSNPYLIKPKILCLLFQTPANGLIHLCFN